MTGMHYGGYYIFTKDSFPLDDADIDFFQPSQSRRAAMQFVAKKAGTDQIIAVETEQMENGVLVRVDGVAVMQCIDNQQVIEIYPKKLESRALTVKIVDE